ncbi:alpha/beta hydrolase [Agromyces sp. SYSU T00194]|uniref:alpha/beta hydrolase n=1 Tax=Agromyces chitinivorans TaxID=3158560 RepID=UPI0033933CA7
MSRGSEPDWQPDVLGERYEQLTLPLAEDDEGEVVATLVRHRPRFRWRLTPGAAADCDVLYVHGWSDYFFQTELAEFWADAGARFFALDLRKYGRSLRGGQTPGFVNALAAYDEDIEAALAAMGHPIDGPVSARPLILLGHSTGGLTLALWAARHPGVASALILNSPWLEFQASRIGREAMTPLIDLSARVDPRGGLPNVDLGFYTRAVAEEQGGEWTYDHAWRPDRGFPAPAGWLSAVLAGHARVAAGIDVGAPVLTLLSKRTTIQARWSEEMRSSDSVLVVDEMAERALRLGPSVTVERIDGALHDVFLSRPEVRQDAYARVTRWLRGFSPV